MKSDVARGFDLFSGRLDIGLCGKTTTTKKLEASSRAAKPQETLTPVTGMTSLECSESGP